MKQRKLLIVEMSILSVALVIAGLCIYFFLNQFKAEKTPVLPGTSIGEGLADYPIVQNYISFPVLTTSFEKTVGVSGYISIPEEAIVTILLKKSDVKDGQCFDMGDRIGEAPNGSSVTSTGFGCVLKTVENDDGNIMVSYLDYQNVDLIFTLENAYHGAMDYEAVYDCRIGSMAVPIKLHSISVDMYSGTFNCVFHIDRQRIGKDFLLTDSDACRLILSKQSFSMPCITRDIAAYMTVSEGQQMFLTIRRDDGRFIRTAVTIAVIGDEYIGLESKSDLKNAAVCVENGYD